MHVAVIKIHLRIAGNNSLKGKRQAVRPIIAGLRNRYNVSAAEVACQNSHQNAVIGISVVASDKRLADELVSSVLEFVNSGRFDVEVIEEQVEIIPV
ncbi:MAG: DUF503 domain-containing protein [Dehalococcoidales bacterium]|nr:DUF503 domain-containing protein [Dehalococcoidales bacterium]